MIVNNIPEIGLEHISGSYKTLNGVGVCFFDPLSEALIEFNSNTKIPVYPSEESYRRFFIVKDSLESSFLALNTIALQTEATTDYTVKIVNDKSIDISTVPDNNTFIEFFSNYPSGIIPFYLYIKSNISSYIDVDLKLILTVE